MKMLNNMKLVKTNSYLLLIDKEAEIKENTWYENNGALFLSDEKYDDGNNPSNSNPIVTNYNSSVIAYYPLTKEAKELNLPLLPPFEDINYDELEIKYYQELEEKRLAAINFKGQVAGRHPDNLSSREIHVKVSGFIEGYKAAQQSDKQFSLEDMETLMEEALNWWGGGRDKDIRDSKEFFEKYIQSLFTQRMPKEFIPEYEIGVYPKTGKQAKRLKTIINSEDKQVLVGNYKY